MIININSKKIATIIFFIHVIILFAFFNPYLIPLRWLAGFIYLTFIIGFLILSTIILKNGISEYELLDIILYSLGLSISFLMLLGFLINFLYPIFGIKKPFSEWPLLLTLYVVTIPLTSFLLKSDFNLSFEVHHYNLVIFLSILPFLSVLGAYKLRYFNSNTILILLYAIIIITLLFVLLMVYKFDSNISNIYWYIIWTFSIALLLSVSLIRRHVIGGDSHIEFYFANLVQKNGVWNLFIQNSKNSLLSIVVLSPLYSKILNVSLVTSFLVICPIIYSYTPVVVYQAFKRKFNENIAFYSTLFFIFMHTFFTKFSMNTRTAIAELFFCLYLLTFVSEEIYNEFTIKLFGLIFLMSIIFSHYGSAYYIMFILIIFTILHMYNNNKSKILNTNLVIIYTVTLLGWYIYTASSANFMLSINFISKFITKLLSNPVSSRTSYTVYAVHHKWPFSVECSMYILIISIVFVIFGIFKYIKEIGFRDDYSLFSLAIYGLLLSTLLPTRGFAVGRAYHLSLCFLAPFIYLGMYQVAKFFLKSKLNKNNFIVLFSLLLIIFFAFNSGIISETITKDSDYSPNILLSKPRMQDIRNPQYVSALYREYETDGEFYSAKWMLVNVYWIGKINIHLDVSAENAVYALLGPRYYIHVNNKNEVKRGYIYLRTYNVQYGLSIYHMLPWLWKSVYRVYPLNESANIYSNDLSRIYYKHR